MSSAMPLAVETHISLLFHVGNRVYKLRKPVQFDFLDFRAREARRLDCQREVALNRRLSPDVYLGVADIEMNGELIDHMVVMKRLPDSRKLATLARQGSDLAMPLEQVAKVLVEFHARAERSSDISAAATGAALREGWEANFSEVDGFVGTVLDEPIESEIRSLARRWTDRHGPLFEERIASGRVCDGHGDLQADDVFLVEEGVRILDCVEFCDRLRYNDVSAEVAFLAMDLERLGRGDAARQFLLLYRAISGDDMPDALVHYYSASRAYVRAKVCCLRSEQGFQDAREEARLFHALALDHLRRARVSLVLVGGLPGTGKSKLSASLGAARGWTVLRSDQIRRELTGLEEREDVGYLAGAYSREATGVVYRELLQRAQRILGSGESVILDASWVDASWRNQARAVADRTGSDTVELRCESTPEDADQRIVRRLAQHADISDATPAVRAAMSRAMDPWESAVRIDTSAATPAETLALALEALGD